MNKSQLPRITRADMEKEVMTRGKLGPIIEDLKEFIRSTAKGTEYFLDNKIEGAKQELRQEMKGMEQRLAEKIDKNSKQLDNHETRITSLETARV